MFVFVLVYEFVVCCLLVCVCVVVCCGCVCVFMCGRFGVGFYCWCLLVSVYVSGDVYVVV